jgi:penicillin-binding protein 1B
VVWIGRDDNKPAGLSGAQGAMRLWGDIMAQAAQRSVHPARPSNVVERWVQPAEALLADASCKGAVLAPFIRDSAPGRDSPCLKSDAGDAEPGFFQRFFQ